jgi:hypothetical protein
MGFNIPKFSLPKVSLPKISLPKFQAPKINLPNPQQVFGMFKGSNAPKPQVRVSTPKPNLLQRAANFGQSFVKNPVAATQRLQQKVTNKVVNTAKYVGSGTVNNTKRLANHAGTQFKRFENWADKGIKNNYNWAQQNRNSKNLLNRVTANANLGFTKVAKGTNDVINTSSTYYRGLRKSNNWLVKGAGYAGGLATSIGRGLASPVTFADPRLSGKQRTGQVVDGVLSYIPVGKVLGLGGKAVKAVGGPILRFGGNIIKPIGGQIAKRAPWLVKGGAKVVAGSKNIAGNIAASKGSQFVKNKLVTPFVNRVAKPTINGLTKLNNVLNRKITFKDVRNLPQTIGTGFNNLRKSVSPARLRNLGNLPKQGQNLLTKTGNGFKSATGVLRANGSKNPLRNISVGTRQKLANSGTLPMSARANARKGVGNITNQVVEGNKRKTLRDFQGSTLEETLRKNGIKSTFSPEELQLMKKVGLKMQGNVSNPADWKKIGLGEIVEKALKRTDLDTKTLKSIDETLHGLQKSLESGRLVDNKSMRNLISDLGKESPKKVSESLAELERANHILKHVELESGTKVIIGAKEGQQIGKATGLPDIDVAKVEADVYYKTKDGVIHLDEVKDTVNALTSKIDDGIKAAKKGADPKQFERYGDWVKQGGAVGQKREAIVVVRNSSSGFDSLLEKRRIDELGKLANGDLEKPILQVGRRVLSTNDLAQIERDAMAKLGGLISENPGKKPVDLAKEFFGSMDKTFETLGKKYGKEL